MKFSEEAGTAGALFNVNRCFINDIAFSFFVSGSQGLFGNGGLTGDSWAGYQHQDSLFKTGSHPPHPYYPAYLH